MAIGSKVNDQFVLGGFPELLCLDSHMSGGSTRDAQVPVYIASTHTVVIVLSQQYTELKQILVSENGGVVIYP